MITKELFNSCWVEIWKNIYPINDDVLMMILNIVDPIIREDERKRIAGNVPLEETSQLLLTVLQVLGNEYGPSGVLGAAMKLVDDE